MHRDSQAYLLEEPEALTGSETWGRRRDGFGNPSAGWGCRLSTADFDHNPIAPTVGEVE